VTVSTTKPTRLVVARRGDGGGILRQIPGTTAYACGKRFVPPRDSPNLADHTHIYIYTVRFRIWRLGTVFVANEIRRDPCTTKYNGRRRAGLVGFLFTNRLSGRHRISFRTGRFYSPRARRERGFFVDGTEFQTFRRSHVRTDWIMYRRHGWTSFSIPSDFNFFGMRFLNTIGTTDEKASRTTWFSAVRMKFVSGKTVDFKRLPYAWRNTKAGGDAQGTLFSVKFVLYD